MFTFPLYTFVLSSSLQRYLDEWEAEKVTYSEQLKVYHNSPAYKTWLEAKHQAEMQAKRAAMLEQQRAYTPPPPQVIPTTQVSPSSLHWLVVSMITEYPEACKATCTVVHQCST